MKKYIISAVLFSLFLITFLFILDQIVTIGLKKNISNDYIDWNRIYDGDIDSDLIINGSSIAEVQISPRILDSMLNVNSYNFGMSGFSFLMQKAKYDLFLEHNDQPEILIQIVGDTDLTKKQELFKRRQFLPYLSDTIISAATRKYVGLNYLDYHLPFFRYSGEVETITKGFASFLNYEFLKSNKYKGYLYNDIEWDNKFEEFVKTYPEGKTNIVSDSIKNSLDTFIKNEKGKGMEVYLVFPPTYKELEYYMKNRKDVIEIYRNISQKHDVPFLDYSSSDLTKDKKLYYNATHLNKKGSELFSELLASDILLLRRNR